MDLRILLRTKEPHDNNHPVKLRRCLTAFDLTLMGIGALIGAGIFVLTGIAAATKAGPAIIFSYALAGFACVFSALSYAELASSIGGCGSAYGYAYAGLGEFFAWIIGWDLLLEYGVSTSAVATGWSGYFSDMLQSIGFKLPMYLRSGPFEHGIFNLPAALIVFIVMVLLAIGVKESARFNALMVIIKLSVLGIFIAVACSHFNSALWHPFLPFGKQGIVNGAALIFFSYIGFDAVSTAAEEAKNPERDLPIGILASLVICTFLYMIVSGLLTGIVHYSALNVASPVAFALLQIGHRALAGMVAAGAIAGLTTVILVMYYGFTRVFLAMSRDGLLPHFLGVVNPKTLTPVRIILGVGVLMIINAGIIPFHHLAELVNIGTLTAFVMVCVGTIILRYTKPTLHRPFKTPFSPLFPAIGALLCLYLIVSLPAFTIIRFIVWWVIGFVIYLCYSRYSSSLAKKN